MIELQNVTAGLGNVQILHQLSWKMRTGENWLVRGRVGSGKTTFAKLLCKKARIFEGHVYFENKLITSKQGSPFIQMISFTDESKLFHGVNAMHYYQQRYNAFDADGHLTVRQYLESHGVEPEQHDPLFRTLEIHQLLEMERIKLSSGQTRRLLLAKALACRPRILILDNAFVGLDQKGRKTFNSLIDTLAVEGSSNFIMIGNEEDVPDCITSCLILHQGRILKKEPEESIPPKSLIHQVSAHFQTSSLQQDNPVLEMRNVTVHSLNSNIFTNFNWTILPGEKWALTGPNGSGKSTLLALIYADHPQAYSNHVKLFGRQRGKGESIWEIKKRIGFTSPEIHSYFHQPFTGLELVLSGLKDSFVVPKRTTNQERKTAKLLFSLFEIDHLLHRQFSRMSTGEQRLIFFFRSLIKAPELLLLDEPFQGMDAQMISLCRSLLSSILDDRHTLIFVSHFVKEIPENVNRILSIKVRS